MKRYDAHHPGSFWIPGVILHVNCRRLVWGCRSWRRSRSSWRRWRKNSVWCWVERRAAGKPHRCLSSCTRRDTPGNVITDEPLPVCDLCCLSLMVCFSVSQLGWHYWCDGAQESGSGQHVSPCCHRDEFTQRVWHLCSKQISQVWPYSDVSSVKRCC